MSTNNKRRILLSVTFLSVIALLISYFVYLSPASQRNRKLLDQTTALKTFNTAVASLGKDIKPELVKVEEPSWANKKYSTSPYPITLFDYKKQWVVQQGKISFTLNDVHLDKQSILSYEANLEKAGFSQIYLDRAGQKAAIQKIIDSEPDPNGYWHNYYKQVDMRRSQTPKLFIENLDKKLAENKYFTLTYYSLLYELKVTYITSDQNSSVGSALIELKYGCKKEYDCYQEN